MECGLQAIDHYLLKKVFFFLLVVLVVELQMMKEIHNAQKGRSRVDICRVKQVLIGIVQESISYYLIRMTSIQYLTIHQKKRLLFDASENNTTRGHPTGWLFDLFC